MADRGRDFAQSRCSGRGKSLTTTTTVEEKLVLQNQVDVLHCCAI